MKEVKEATQVFVWKKCDCDTILTAFEGFAPILRSNELIVHKYCPGVSNKWNLIGDPSTVMMMLVFV
jgi:hypothetical protein